MIGGLFAPLAGIIAVLAASGSAPAQPHQGPAAEQETAHSFIDTRFRSGDAIIPARLLLPRGSGPFPVAVKANGVGSMSRTDPAWLRFYKHSLDAGVAFLIFDDRGTDDTPGSYEGVPLSLIATDVLAAVRHAKTLPQVDAGRVGIIGYSRGGWTGPLAATLGPGEVAFMLLISPPAMSELEQNIYDKSNDLLSEGFSAEEVEEVARFRSVVWRYYATGTGYDNAKRVWAQASLRPWFAKLKLKPAPASPDEVNGEAFAAYRRQIYDPLPALRRLDMPVLAVFGINDAVVDAEASAAVLTRIFQETAHKDATIVSFVNGGHNIRYVDGVTERAGFENFVPGYFQTVANWLKLRTSVR